jgi:hypothetical protein
MAWGNMILIGLCGIMGFGIIWSMIPGKNKDGE